MWAERVAGRLRQMRRAQQLGQDHVADALDISVSEVSRLERGVRGLRVEQLGPWAHALQRSAEILFWHPARPRCAGSCDRGAINLDDESVEILEEVAAALPHMDVVAREALRQQVRVWRSFATHESMRVAVLVDAD